MLLSLLTWFSLSLSQSPDEVIFVMDSMIGQAAHDQAKAFREAVDVGGLSPSLYRTSRCPPSFLCDRIPCLSSVSFFHTSLPSVCVSSVTTCNLLAIRFDLFVERLYPR